MGPGRPEAARGPRRPFGFRDGLRHSVATHLFAFAALFLTGVGPESGPEPHRRDLLIAVHAPPAHAPQPRLEPERELEQELPPEPELMPVVPETRVPLPEPELAEVSDPREVVRRLPLETLTRILPPPDPEPPVVAAAEPPAAVPVPDPEPDELTPPAAVTVVAVRHPPLLLRSEAPAYPLASYRMGHQGAVLLRIQVARDGSVTGVELVESSGYDRLDQAALAAVRRWRFQPASEDGATVAGDVLHRVVFRIES